MLIRSAVVLVALVAGFVVPAGTASAQPYPPPGYYRYPPPPPPFYRGPAPSEADDDDDTIGVPGGPPAMRPPVPIDPYADSNERSPYNDTARVVPGPVERSPYGLPPPGVEPYQPGPSAVRPPAAPPNYGPPPSGPGYAPSPSGPDPDYGAPTALRPPGDLRPPAEIGPRSTPPQSPQQSVAALPPDIEPEVGERKELPPNLKRQIVDYRTKEPTGTIIIDTPNTYLYIVLGNGKAMRYGIGVGREGFTWSGTQRVARMAEWPDWIPPQEMIERQPYLPRFMAGGPGNPLGARALYLGNTLYRIHGTNQPSTIGQFVSSGCIRLLNEDIEDLYQRVTVGTRVVVLPGGKPPASAQVQGRDITHTR
jgi:lipoprotein-anchoring transpeptidase ErfK/SrfK